MTAHESASSITTKSISLRLLTGLLPVSIGPPAPLFVFSAPPSRCAVRLRLTGYSSRLNHGATPRNSGVAARLFGNRPGEAEPHRTSGGTAAISPIHLAESSPPAD